MGERTIAIPQHLSPVAYLTGEYPKVSHTFIQREVEALRKLGVPVQTFSIRRASPKDIPADQKDEENQTFYVLEHCKDLGRLWRAHLTRLASTPGAYFKTLKLAWSLRQAGWRSMLYQLFYFVEAVVIADEVQKRGIVHLHNHFGDSSCSVAVLTSTLCGVPYSFTEHGPAIFFEAKRWHVDKKIAHAQFVVAISHFCRSQLMLFSDAEHWSKIAIVHCGVDPNRYKPGTTSFASKRVLYVGRLEPVKGLLVLLEAIAKLKNHHPDMQVTIVGDGSSRGMIEARAQQLGLAGMIAFVGYKTQDEVAALLAATDVLVLPSFAEGVPVVLMEAMASGKPVIASRVAGVQELVEDGVNGFTVPPGDSASLAERIKQMLADPVARERLGKTGRMLVEQSFNVDIEGRLLAQLFADAQHKIGKSAETGRATGHQGDPIQNTRKISLEKSFRQAP